MISYLHFAPSGEDPDFAPDFRLGFGVRPVDVETDDILRWVTRITVLEECHPHTQLYERSLG